MKDVFSSPKRLNACDNSECLPMFKKTNLDYWRTKKEELVKKMSSNVRIDAQKYVLKRKCIFTIYSKCVSSVKHSRNFVSAKS
jgi:hypothetical protein